MRVPGVSRSEATVEAGARRPRHPGRRLVQTSWGHSPEQGKSERSAARSVSPSRPSTPTCAGSRRSLEGRSRLPLTQTASLRLSSRVMSGGRPRLFLFFWVEPHKGPSPTLTLVANSRRRPTGRSLGRIGYLGGRKPRFPTAEMNSPPASTLASKRQSEGADISQHRAPKGEMRLLKSSLQPGKWHDSEAIS